MPAHIVNANQREATAREELERAIMWRVIAEANIPQQVTAAVAMLGSHSGDRKRRDRPAVVAARVAGDLTPSWRAPVAQRAHEGRCHIKVGEACDVENKASFLA